MMRKCIGARIGFARARAAVTDSSAGAESFQRRGYHSLLGSDSPSCRLSPFPGRTGGPGGSSPFIRCSLGVVPPAAPSTPGGPGGWDPANSGRDCHPGLVRPNRLYRGAARFESPYFPASSGGLGKGMGRGLKARPLEEQEGQTQRLGQRDQRSPRPLPEGSRGEERPRRLFQGALTSPHPCGALWGLTRRRVKEWRATPAGNPGCARCRLKVCCPPTPPT